MMIIVLIISSKDLLVLGKFGERLRCVEFQMFVGVGEDPHLIMIIMINMLVMIIINIIIMIMIRIRTLS